jgi:hypothetical protein
VVEIYGGYGNETIFVYLCILLLCIFRPLIFLALNTQRGHWVDAGVWITVVAVVDGVSRGRFDSSWVRVFIDVPIANDAEAVLQDRVLVLCGVGTRNDDVVVIFFAMDAGRDGMVRVNMNMSLTLRLTLSLQGNIQVT